MSPPLRKLYIEKTKVMNNDRAILNTSQEHEIFGDRDLPSWLTQQQISLACTTYQTSRLMLLGAAPETNKISAFWRIFDRAMALYCTRDIAVYKNNQIIFGRSNLGRFVAVAGGSRFAGADCVVLFAVWFAPVGWCISALLAVGIECIFGCGAIGFVFRDRSFLRYNWGRRVNGCFGCHL